MGVFDLTDADRTAAAAHVKRATAEAAITGLPASTLLRPVERATVIGAGTKFSNLVTIGHGTKVGEHCMFVGQVGIAGSVNVGNNVTMAGKVGVAGHLEIGDRAQLAAMTGVMRNVPADSKVAGAPAMPIQTAMRAFSMLEKLPDMSRQIKKLEAQIRELQSRLDEQD